PPLAGAAARVPERDRPVPGHRRQRAGAGAVPLLDLLTWLLTWTRPSTSSPAPPAAARSAPARRACAAARAPRCTPPGAASPTCPPRAARGGTGGAISPPPRRFPAPPRA